MATVYPTLEEALHLHQLLIDKWGGEPGLRDAGLLESALYRPQSGYYDTLSQQAAALIQSLAGNHCFIDGNKRVAYALTAVFLRLNGWSLQAKPDDAEHFVVTIVITNQSDLPTITTWIEQHIHSI